MASINLQGDTSGSISISAPSVAGSNTLTLPATTQTLATQNALGVRNLIINGDMRIAQRGTNATGLTNGSGGYHTVDRWKFIESGTPTFVFTQTQDTDVPTGQGFSNSLKMDCTTAQGSLAAGDNLYISQIIESQNLQHIKKGTSNAESLTLSFWVKSNKTGTYILGIQEFQNTRYIGKTYTINSADTWENKTITIEGDTTGALTNDNSSGIFLQFYLAAGTDYTSGTLPSTWESTVNANRAVGQVNLADSTSNYINITGVQLEVGDTATPFEHRPYDMELLRCQRYYWQIVSGNDNTIANGVYYNPTTFICTVQYPVTMRTAPSLSYVTGTGYYTIYVGGTDAINGFYLGAVTATTTNVESGGQGASGTTGYGGQLRSASTSARAGFTAEL